MNKLVNMMQRVKDVKKQVSDVSTCIQGAENSMFFVVKGGDCTEAIIQGEADLSKFHSLLEEYVEYKEASIATDVDTLTAIDGLLSVGDESKPCATPSAQYPAQAPAPVAAPMAIPQQAPWSR